MQATAEAPPEQAPAPEPVTSVKQLFRFSTWVHVGPGAETCEEAEGGCADPLHFHAWCRLPNQFQHRQIREKAMAAKARRTRQLRDPETDAYAVLEEELDQIARLGDSAKEQLVDELLGRDWWRDFLEATKDVQEREDEQGEQPFSTIEEDQRRFTELDAKPADERPADEYAELERHLSAYNEAVEARHKEIEAPRRDALEERDLNALIDLVRDERIGAESMSQFMHIYSVYEWLAGTLVKPGGEPRFKSLAQLEDAAPEVVEALQQTFDDLEKTQQQGESAAKN